MKIIWIFLLFALSPAEDFVHQAEVGRGLDLVMKMEYDSAYQTFSKMGAPAGSFFAMTALAARFYDLHDTASLPLLYALGDSVLKMTQERPEPAYRFYRAAAQGYLSLFLSGEGRWFKGALLGRKAARAFETLAAEGVGRGDGLGMAGCYHFWSSVYLKKHAWLPFVEDNRERGLAEVEQGLLEAVYLKFALSNSLFWIYYHEKKFDKALALCDQVLREYPGNRQFRKARMDALYKLGRFDEAQSMGPALLKEYEGLERVPLNYYLIKIKMGMLYFSMGRATEGEAVWRELKSTSYGGYLEERLAPHLESLDKLRSGPAK